MTHRPLTQKKKRKTLALLFLAVVVIFVFALCSGPNGLSFAWFFDRAEQTIVFQLRLRRIMLALLTGTALAVAGATLQALLRNPLADPFVIGVSGGAAVGGGFAIFLGLSTAAMFLPLASFIGAMFATAILSWFLQREGSASSDATLLAGVILNAFAAALVTLMKTLLPAADAQSLLFWLVGTIGYPTWTIVGLIATAVSIGTIYLLRNAGHLELMALGEIEARRLGINTMKVKWGCYLATALLVGVIIPFTGMIGFVGLVVPHVLKMTLGSDLRLVLPASALAGAAVLGFFDAGARLSFVFTQTELPVGSLTALFGAPVFAWALITYISPRNRS
jgi:iron complex transport system permease protein